MPTLIPKRSRKAGLPPGSLVHIGGRRAGEPTVSVLSYDEAGFEERQAASLTECVVFKDKPAVTWLNVEGLHQVELIEKLGQCHGLHPLLLEDVLNTEQRPKLEDYGGYIFIVLKMLSVGEGEGQGESEGDEVRTEQVSLVLGPNYVISFQEGAGGDVFDPVRERIRGGKGRVRQMGADYLAYALMDAVIDNYFLVLEKLGERIELLEDELVADPRPATVRAIHELKRHLIFLRKSVWPLREVVGALERGESALIQKETAVYLRDTYDHTIQVIDTLETYRDMISGMLDIYLSSISNRMNEIMKVLTIIATIFIPLTFIVGVYGMNFHYMPELEWRWGYAVVWGIMAAVALGMLVYFRRKRWV